MKNKAIEPVPDDPEQELPNPLHILFDDAITNAQDTVEDIFKGSKLFSKDRKFNLPAFGMNEFHLGNVLGCGEFCVVQSVNTINVIEHKGDKSSSYEIFPPNFTKGDDMESKGRMAENCVRKSTRREKYVVKYLKAEVKSNPSSFRQAIIDLTIETQILSVVDHPNIVKLQGFNKEALFEPSYLIVLDQLKSTLDDKMEGWMKEKRSRTSLSNLVPRKKSQRVKEKLKIATSLSCALAYLHTLKIVHRDLKPDNMGFDHKGELKIFDFGLSNELRREKMLSNGLYNMTGNTGSRRYMAPEVAREEPYNQTVDIYSFGILLWEMMAAQKAFDGYSIETHDILVAQVGERPDIPSSWAEPIKDITAECWAHDCKHRPQSDSLYLTIKTILDSL